MFFDARTMDGYATTASFSNPRIGSPKAEQDDGRRHPLAFCRMEAFDFDFAGFFFMVLWR